MRIKPSGWALAGLAAALCALGPAGARAEDASVQDPAAAGRAVYLDYGCAQCHGTVAQGSISTPAIPGFPLRPLVAKLRSKTGGMPFYSEKVLSDENAALIAAYLAALPPSRPASEIPALSR